MEDKETASNSGSVVMTKEEVEEIEELNNELYSPQPHRTMLLKRNIPSHEDPFSNTLEEREMEDEDKLFLLSLVPSFKRLNENQKLDVKMEFLEAIKRVRNVGHFNENFKP